jgi:hypothetical protein
MNLCVVVETTKGRPKRRFDREKEPSDDDTVCNTFDGTSNERAVSGKRTVHKSNKRKEAVK